MCAKTRGPTKHRGYEKGNGYPNDHVILCIRFDVPSFADAILDLMTS